MQKKINLYQGRKQPASTLMTGNQKNSEGLGEKKFKNKTFLSLITPWEASLAKTSEGYQGGSQHWSMTCHMLRSLPHVGTREAIVIIFLQMGT